jgi:xanthine dehydrogenase YagS FAD-binding subunit
MRKFTHITPSSVEQAIPLLSAAARPIAGGTDVIPLAQGQIREPEQLVNIKTLGALRGVSAGGAGGLRIGALATLADLHRSPEVAEGPYAALAQAAMSAASPQLRNVATIGGNLLQEVRCWYYRGPFHCWMKGGDECQAREGENQFHAIRQQSPCVAVHPSDPATALLALDASVHIAGPSGERTVPLAEFLQPPTEQRRALHTLGESELITGVSVPDHAGWRSAYHKAMERAVWAFALIGVAVVARVESGAVADIRIAAGAVANVPLRLTAAEDALRGQTITPELAQRAGELAVEGAEPLAKNGYKVELLRRMMAEAVTGLA